MSEMDDPHLGILQKPVSFTELKAEIEHFLPWNVSAFGWYRSFFLCFYYRENISYGPRRDPIRRLSEV